MSKSVYIQIFIGDWIRDTRALSPGARGIYTELLMHLQRSEEVGVKCFVITELPFLLGVCYDSVIALLEEIFIEGLLKRENIAAGKIRISDPEMIKANAKKRVKSEAGQIGMKKRWKKSNAENESVITESITPVITNVITHNGIDIGNDNGNETGNEGGAGGNEKTETKKVTIRDGNQILKIEECLDAFMTSQVCARGRELLLRKFTDKGDDMPTAMKKLCNWGEAFNDTQKMQLVESRALGEWTSHFSNWLNKRDINTNQKNIQNGNQSGQNNGKWPNGNRSIISENILQPGDSFFTKE